MELSAFGGKACEAYEELLEHDICIILTVVTFEGPFTGEVFDVWEQSALRADQAGLKRWAVVADGITAISPGRKVDSGSLETTTTENRSEAVAWVERA